MTCFDCCFGVSHQAKNLATSPKRTPQQNCCVALGVILSIGSVVAAGVLYSYLGYASLACLVLFPIGNTIIWKACLKSSAKAPSVDTSIYWGNRVRNYLLDYLSDEDIRSCKICLNVKRGGLSMPPVDIILTKNDTKLVLWDTVVNNGGLPDTISFAIVYKAGKDLFNCRLLSLNINNKGEIAEGNRVTLDGATLQRVGQYLNDTDIERSMEALSTDLDKI